MSGRSDRLMQAGFRFKGNAQNNIFDFKNDRAYDSVAESLYRIHNKLSKTADRRSNRIQAGVQKRQKYHRSLSERYSLLSELSYQDSERKFEQNINKSQKIENKTVKVARYNKRKGDELNRNNLKKFDKSRTLKSRVDDQHVQYQRNLVGKQRANDTSLQETKGLLNQLNKQKE